MGKHFEFTSKVALENYLKRLRTVLVELTGQELWGSYALENSAWDAALAFSDEYIRLFILLHFGRFTYLNKFYATLLSDSAPIAAATVPDIERMYVLATKVSAGTEYGGGLGSGFQLLCDGEVIISTGGGGGGGASISSDGDFNSPSFGSGGGGGVQISRSFGIKSKQSKALRNSLASFGGGGGCGTCNSNKEFSTRNVTVVCGTAEDDVSLSLAAFRMLLHKQYTHRAFKKQCKRISVSGGGGGGGGIVYPNGSYVGAGYGFRFLFSNQKPEDHDDSDHGQQYLTRVESLDDKSAGSAEQDTEGLHSSFSALMEASVTACRGYADWACICSQVRRQINACSRSRSRAALEGKRSQAADGLNCAAIRAVNSTVQAMLSGSCASYSYSMHAHNTNSINATAPVASDADDSYTDGDDSDLCPSNMTLAKSVRYSGGTTVNYFTHGAQQGQMHIDQAFAWILAGDEALQPAWSKLPPMTDEQLLLGGVEPGKISQLHAASIIVLTMVLLAVFACACRGVVAEVVGLLRHHPYQRLY